MKNSAPRPSRLSEPAAPLEFRGRKAARALNFVMAGFFLVFIGLSFYVMFAVPNRLYGETMGGVMAACLFGLLIVPLQNLAAAYGVVRLDQDGLSMTGPLRNLSVRWSDVESITRASPSSESTVRLNLRGGSTIPLRLYLFEDGDELGRLIRERWTKRASAQDLDAKVYRRPNETVRAFAIAAYAVIGGLTAYWGFRAPAQLANGQPGPPVHGIVVVIALVLLFAVTLPEVGRFAQLTSTHLIIGNRWRRRSISVGQIERVEIANGKIRVWTGGKAVSAPASLVDQAELNERLARLASATSGDAAPSEPPSTGSETFRPSLSSRIGLIAMPLFFAAVVVACTASAFTDPRGTAMYLFGDLVFGSFGAVSLYASLVGLAQFTVDGEGIERQCALGSWRLWWREVDFAWRRGSGLGAFRFSSGGKTYDAEMSAVQRPERLAEFIECHLNESRHPWANEAGHVFRNSNEGTFIGLIPATVVFGAVFYFAIIHTGRPDPSHSGDGRATLFVLFALMLLLFAAMAIGILRRYETTEDGLWIRSLVSKRFLRFTDIVRVVFASNLHHKSNTRFPIMKIEHPDGGIAISSQVDDYVLLEAYVRKHVDSSLVRDQTPDLA